MEALKTYLLQTGLPIFVVLDGAQFDDLPELLFECDLPHRSLYLARGGATYADYNRTAPQLVSLADEKTLDKVTALVGDRPAAAFWACSAGHDALYRHLRGINMVLYPKEAVLEEEDPFEAVEEPPEESERAAGEASEEEPPEGEDTKMDLVTFRHADANSLAQVLPVLRADQFARLLGPAEFVAFLPDEQWRQTRAGYLVALKPRGTITVPAGPLVIDPETVERMESADEAAFTSEIVDYLKEHAEPEVADLTDEELLALAYRIERLGERLGLDELSAYLMLAFMQAISREAPMDEREFAQMCRGLDQTPDETIEDVFDAMTRAAEEAEAGLEFADSRPAGDR